MMNTKKQKPCPSRTQGTLAHFKTTRWTEIKRRISPNNTNIKLLSYRRLGISINISKKEFYNWCDKNSKIIFEIYKNGEKPSVDRINPDGHYTLENMRIIPLGENCRLARKTGRCTPKAVVAKNISTGEEITFYGLWTHKFRSAGFDPSTVQKICKKIPGRGWKSKGYTFKYAGDEWPIQYKKKCSPGINNATK